MAATNEVINHSVKLDEHQQTEPNHHHQQKPHQLPPPHHHQMLYGMMQSSSSSSAISEGNIIRNKDGGAYDLGELDQALFLYLDNHQGLSDPSTEVERQNSRMRPPTLNIFPSQPMHVEPSLSKANNTGLSSPATSDSKRPLELAKPRNESSSGPADQASKPNKGNRKALSVSSLDHEGPKTPDPKTLKRLAQNREAARKSRLRKKAYVQQLETSRMRLTQLEQELQRARSQGFLLGGGAVHGGEQSLINGASHLTSEAAVFDMEYARWLEEHHRIMCELRAAIEEDLPESELRLYVETCLAHFDEMITLKSMIVKSDVFHLFSGMWKTPAERCFMWMGGFRPSELIKIILNHVEPSSEQQVLGICSLQQSTQEAEEALTQGLEALNRSLSDAITLDSLSCPPNMASYMGQMAMAMSKLSTMESFVRQADNLRHQTVHRLHQLLSIRQSARCLLAIAEYFHRLRALSSLWLTRSRQE